MLGPLNLDAVLAATPTVTYFYGDQTKAERVALIQSLSRDDRKAVQNAVRYLGIHRPRDTAPETDIPELESVAPDQETAYENSFVLRAYEGNAFAQYHAFTICKLYDFSYNPDSEIACGMLYEHGSRFAEEDTYLMDRPLPLFVAEGRIVVAGRVVDVAGGGVVATPIFEGSQGVQAKLDEYCVRRPRHVNYRRQVVNRADVIGWDVDNCQC